MNKQQRNTIKEAVLNTLQSYGAPLALPIPIKKITKSFSNVRLIPFSIHMKRNNLSYSEMLEFAGSEDACTDYNGQAGLYIIYYNDRGANQLSSNRYRWSIAHELGHIVLDHHKKHKESKIFRSTISKGVYKTLEAEADMFAAYLLVPHIVLHCFGIQDNTEIASLCQISGTASKIRLQNFETWRKGNRCEPYDLAILTCYTDFVESHNLSKRAQSFLNRHRRCRHCGTLIPLSHAYCRICGKETFTEYRLEINPMKYPGIEIDDKGRTITCPICNNTELAADGDFCMICGTEIVNRCLTASDIFSDECSHDEKLPGNARYCPHCGGITSFYKEGYISAWKEIQPRIIHLPPQPVYDRDDDLPF